MTLRGVALCALALLAAGPVAAEAERPAALVACDREKDRGRLDEARRCYTALLEKDPPPALGAEAHWALGDPKRANAEFRRAAEAEPRNKERQPVTLGVAEPFTTTVSIAFYVGLLLALPLLLFQLYAFILPAFAPGERKVAVPLMALVPFLFFAGVAFGYFIVLPRAIGFLQNFNDDDFDILIQAREYYRFAVVFIGGIGLLFQIPIVVIAITRLNILTPRQLQQNWGYVLLALAILAAVVTPTPDPLTMLLALGPLFLLFEASILLAAWLNRVSPPGHWWGEDADDESFATSYDHED